MTETIRIVYYIDPKKLKKLAEEENENVRVLKEPCDLFIISPSFWNKNHVEIDLGQGKIIVSRKLFEKELLEYRKKLQELEVESHLNFIIDKLKHGSEEERQKIISTLRDVLVPA